MDRKEFGEILTKIRYQNGLTYEEFGKRYNVTYQAASRWERGLKIIEPEILKQICEDYDLNYEKIVNPEKAKKEQRKNIVFILVSVSIILAIIIFTSAFPK